MLTEEEKKQRLGLITSSVAYDVVQENHHKAWRQIMGLENLEYSEQMERGDKLEPVLIPWSAEKLSSKLGYPLTARKPGFRRHPHLGWAGDSCDVHYQDPTGHLEYIGEIKTANARADYGEESSDAVPERALIQCHWHLLHHPEVDVCVLSRLGGWDLMLRQYYIQRDHELERMLVEAGERFYRDYLLPQKEPPADGDRDTTEWFNRISYTEDYIPATDDMMRLAIAYNDAKSKERKAAKEAAEASNQLKQALGSANGAISGSFLLKITNVAESTYTTTRSAYKKLTIQGV